MSSPTASAVNNKHKASPILHSFNLNPHLVLRRRSSLVIDDLPLSDIRRNSHTEEGHESTILEESNGLNGSGNVAEKVLEKTAKEKKQPTQFQEPDSNSLLDSFGF